MSKIPTAQTVDRALDLLDLFTVYKPEWSLTDLAREANLHVSIVNRLVGSLVSRGFLRRNSETKKYSLGFKVYRLYHVISNTTSLHNVALRYMQQLRDSTNETVSLMVVHENTGVTIERLLNNTGLRTIPQIGIGKPLYVGSRKVLLAFMPKARIKEITSQGLEKFANNTITDPDQLMARLREIKQQGYCLSVGELTPGVKSIAVPIWKNGTVIGALSINGPAFRITKGKERNLIMQLQKVAQNIAQEMGNLSISTIDANTDR